MIIGRFEQSAQRRPAILAEGLAGAEARLRENAARALEKAYNRAAAGLAVSAIVPETAKNCAILKAAFRGAGGAGNSAFRAEFEETLSLSSAHRKEAFHEALIRLHDEKGEAIFPDQLFKATDGFDGTDEAGRSLRLWVFAKQMKEFYEKHGSSTPHSLNINPIDMRHDDFREGLEEVLTLAHKNGCKNIVLEALEQAPWENKEAKALKELRSRFGVKIAIDDYGSGYHDSKTLERLAPDFVKLDGHLVRDFIDKENANLVMRLSEIREICPRAAVVAEWVSSPEEINDVMADLDRRGLPEAIHFVQGRELAQETPRHFLSRLAGLRNAAPYCPMPKNPAFA